MESKLIVGGSLSKSLSQPWLNWANNEIGVKRTGKGNGNPRIMEYWKMFGMGGIKSEKTPWCSAFIGASLEAVGINTNSDKSIYKIRVKDSSQYWLYWDKGRKVEPCLGAIAVMERPGGGHVGFIVGQTKTHWILLGGNQGSAVSIAKFNKKSFIGFVLPNGYAPDLNIPFEDAPEETRLS